MTSLKLILAFNSFFEADFPSGELFLDETHSKLLTPCLEAMASS